MEQQQPQKGFYYLESRKKRNTIEKKERKKTEKIKSALLCREKCAEMTRYYFVCGKSGSTWIRTLNLLISEVYL